MELVKFLRDGGTLEQLQQAPYSLKVTQHKEFPELYLFKYNQLESDFNNAIVCESRGIILNSEDNWNVVCRTFDKFFNYGDPKGATIDWSSATIYEKVDGSLCQLYWYKGKWRVATSGTPDASGSCYGWDFTFEELFWKTWNELGYELPREEDQDLCFAFELCTNFNKIIVSYPKPKIVLLGVRWLYQPTEFDCKFSNCEYPEFGVNEDWYNEDNGPYNWEVVKSYPTQSIEALLEVTKSLNPLEQEGFVICDKKFNRIKIKSEQYVALSHIRDGFGPKRIIEVIRAGEVDEVILAFPEFKEQFNEYKAKYDLVVSNLEKSYVSFKDIESQKEFALAIKDTPFNGALFMIRAGKVKSIKEYLSNIPINNLVDYLTK